MQLCGKVTDLLSRLEETPETFTGRILFMSMFNDISCDGKGNEEECVANAKVVSILAKKFGIGQWSFIGPGSEKKWYSMEENSPQGIWDDIAEKMLFEFAESGCQTSRASMLGALRDVEGCSQALPFVPVLVGRQCRCCAACGSGRRRRTGRRNDASPGLLGGNMQFSRQCRVVWSPESV